MPRTHRPYPPEFRAEAVELSRSGTKSIAQLSRELGIADQTLRNWVRQTELVLDALEMALWNRRPVPGLIHHADHGSQYASLAFGRRCPSRPGRRDPTGYSLTRVPAALCPARWRAHLRRGRGHAGPGSG
jgi:hypothetical protein